MSKLKFKRKKAKGIIYLLPFTVYLLPPEIAFAQIPTPSPTLRVVVNSNLDGNPNPDNAVTLREAIAIVNGTLPTAKLSNAEKAQVTPTTGASRIEFNLPAGATTIQLQTQLPDLTTPGLVIDGSTQPGYDPKGSATAEIAIPIPVVTITPAPNQEILRGLTVVADGVTIRGLNIYGFTSKPIKQILGNLAFDTDPKPVTLTTPPGDIVIAHRFPPPDTSRQQPPNDDFPFRVSDVPPKNVVIENNWLGLTASEQMPEQTSAFGVYVFNSQGATIRRNRISYHDGSAIITSVRGENTVVQENILVANGIAGMPDALRFEGLVNQSQIIGNLICGNDGAGVYLFKPQGNVVIQNNKITYNGRRLRRAAVYLMGSNHQVVGNEIDYQAGPGVVVSAFPKNDVGQRKPGVKNIIQNNKFAALEGLSIDLNTQQNLDVSDFQVGDGPNPRRDSPNRRLETGNGAINAPEFKQRAFPPTGNSVTLQGKADRGSQVTIYRLGDYQRGYGALSEPLATVPVDENGNFSTTVANLQTGDAVSAIATDLQYGTSEPALAAIIGTAGTKPNLKPSSPPNQPPQCTSRPVPPPPPEPPAPPPPPEPPEPIRILAPNNVHFALDKSYISSESAAVLDRVAAVLQKYPFIVVELQGHTDPRASNEYNLALGRRRALAVRNYLLRKGISPERMTIRSFGETQRKTQGNTRVDYARDRRTEIIYKDVRGIELIVEPQEQDLQIESPR
ncbi:OmpA family protein [Fischerella thermalis]|uniref:Cell envelope biogenesis protein OmpA n=1 Tax=Fischerella thermalis CCMEE 5318 TaxID=2019666 RepID=A0A2N6LJG7_9CYAN|nr:OmpA family protein [Fischerella thermalis]PMB24572.1 cell envelope biogenesis protein OmpA [Fischerella thermalis CCMEE 5318]